jgi:antitoxin (DNA-binding transcriptional repressor) of toxin-antitoxin stability system
MTATISLEEAQAKLPELIENLAAGSELIITKDQQPVAKLIGQKRERRPRAAPGFGKGDILYIAPDFDETPEEFAEYL